MAEKRIGQHLAIPIRLGLQSCLIRTVGCALLATLGVTTSSQIYRLFWSQGSNILDEKDPSKAEEGSDATKIAVQAGNKPPDLWNTGIFFPCYFPEEPSSSFTRLLYYITSAEQSLKICVMSFSYRTLMKAISKRHEAGVRVQVFTSHTCAHDPKAGRAGKYFRSKGIPIRSMRKTNYSTNMHNKYVIVDDEAILTGSMNWTNTSITQQRENIMVTTDDRIVPKFVIHFDQLWKENDLEVEEKN